MRWIFRLSHANSRPIPGGAHRKRAGRNGDIERMTGTRKIDALDRQIIAALSRQPQISNKDIAAELGVAESTISVRVDALIRAKVIKPSVQQNIARAGYATVGWIEVSCEHADIERIAAEIAEIETVFSISRFFDNPFLQVMVFAQEVSDFREIVETRIGRIPGVVALATDVSIGEACIKSGIASL
jgi:DNA-binding Lrp family transcriptional regulator